MNFISDIIRQCKINPSNTAFIEKEDCRRTYGDFYDLIKRTSGYIKSKGIAPESFVVINLPNSMEYVAVQFGAWLAGCAIAPVNPAYPQSRIDYICSNCESPLLVDESNIGEIKKAEPLEICETTAPIAALYYTSGSTGTPKGVIHTFETLSHIDTFKEYGDARPDDCFAFGAPFSFIAGILIIPFLRVGACLRLIPGETARDIRKLQAFYDRNIATCAVINPPSTLKQLNLKGNKSLRMVITGSERTCNIKPESDYKLFNLYGQTETALTALYFDVDKEYSNTPVGKPTADLEMKIMDDGEICFRGPVSPGYFKDPERSAALWAGGWFHTGDIGRMLPDGNVEYVNRKDWMVKINGQRVETGEISQVIKEVDGVRDAFAKGFTAADGHQYIVAYYIADDSVKESDIKEYLSGKLAPYMIPSYFVGMKSFPVNANGKVDVKALQSPVDLQREVKREIAAPGTEDEKSLCKAFESALGISPVSVEDDFFSLGGDSIRVMQVQVACPELDLSSSLIYTYKTVRAICNALKTQSVSAGISGKECPLSKTQAGIFVECMSRRGEPVYNNPTLIRFRDPVDAEKLAAACEAALAAHPNLFATIRIDQNGSPLQVKNDAGSIKVEVEQTTDEEFDGMRHGLLQPFDILSDRLFRMRLFKTSSSVWLFYDIHHIVFDGTSNVILLEDIEKAYEGFEIKPETYTGFDLACDEQNLGNSPFYEECRKWNLETFSKPDRTSLPDPDRFNDTVDFEKFDTRTSISIHALSKAAERFGVTENVLATGAFGYMLGACSHARNSAFSTIYNGRKSLKTERTISMLVKTLPVYCEWNTDTRVGDYLQAVRDQLLGAMAYDLFSFADICSSTSYDSRVLFSYQDELMERDSLCGARCELISLLNNATGEPLAVQLFKLGGSLVIRTEYRSNMYSEGYVRKFINCFENVLSSLVLAPKDMPSSKLDLVTEDEKKQLIALGWGKKLDYDKNETVACMFRKNVAEHPDYTAVVDENGSISYSELDILSDRLAAVLQSNGVGEEDFVALMLPRLRHFPASYLACFKCGAAYIPMDCEYPIDRLQYMIEDSGTEVLLTTHEIFDRKSTEGRLEVGKIIFVDDVLNAKQQDTKEIEVLSRPEGLAYMIYTSGTTGKPKGVMIEHRALSNLVHSFIDAEKLKPGVRIAQHASFSFDGSIPDLMCPLSCGGQLHLLPSKIRKDLAAMYRYFCDNRIDGVILTTQLGLTMLRMYDLKIKFMMLGGEKMTGSFNTSIHLYNGYGPTEFTVCSSYYLLDTGNIPDNIPIGRAVPNTFSGVVDAGGSLLPRGVAGELVLAGPQLSRGYWRRDDITAERFVDCPFLHGEKMYRTGDLAKWDEDGNLLFLGRIDTQIKLRGFRIELGEIESNLSRFEGIKSSAVAVKEISGVQHLCAYYVSDNQIDKELLRARLSESLTDYMVPTVYVQMDDLPMTPNGKVDLGRLPVPEIKADEIVEPQGEMERHLFEIAAEYLKNRDFGVTSNLISLGMTSLGAITLSLQIERKAGVSIPSPKILEMPTIRQWAAYLKETGEVQEESLPSYPQQELYPLTDNQTGIYIDWEQHKDSTQYNVPMLFRFEGVSAEQVSESVKSFVRAHRYIKTNLVTSEGGEIMQVRNDNADVEVSVGILDKEPGKDFFQNLIKPFDLFSGPLFRFHVFGCGKFVWLVSDIHHIVFDGGSEAVLARELASSLNGTAISPESFSAFDYSLYYRDWKNSVDFEKASQYFTSILEGTVAATLPQTSAPVGTGSETATVSVKRKPVREMSRTAGVTENALILTAVTEVLHRFCREQNIAILTVSSGRSLRALERTCGMFVQTLPVVSHQSDRRIGESLALMHNQVIDTIAHDKYPYTKIVENTGLKAGILLAYQGDVLGGPLKVKGSDVTLSGLALDTAKFPLSINVTPDNDDIRMDFEYDRSVYGEGDIRHFASAVVSFIQNIVSAGPDAQISTVPCVSTTQEGELIALGSGPEMKVEDGTMVGLFKRNAAAYPDDPAVSDCCSTITYGMLDKYSDRLAGILLSSGLQKEDFVCLMLPRRKEFIVSMLSVFKAGGAYLPLDFEYPVERLQYMIDDSMSKFLVTTHELFEQKAGEGNLKACNIIFVDDMDFSSSGNASEVDYSTPDGIAYMIYTSGTTGNPKGVMIEHHSLMNMISWNAGLEKCVRGTRAAGHASFSFDASVVDLVTTIAFGGHLFIFDEVTRKDPAMMLKYIMDNKIEVMCVSTQLGMMLLNSYELPLRHILMGGEKLTGKYGGNITVVNGYGPTEFTVCSSYHILEGENESDNIPIGRAVPNTLSAVVDTYGCLVPNGVPGELVLIGAQIARGYWNKDEMTGKRFVPCPFVPGERMYRTGDLVRWNEDGELLFMGRIDTQVKLRGFRIELGEIESRVAEFRGVSAAVAKIAETGGVQHLCAYFTATDKVDTEALKTHLASCLTSYMMPDALVQLDQMPLTPNGKIDLKRLPDPDFSKSVSASSYEAPEGELEEIISEVFQKVLGGSKPLSRNSSFFQMGGTSLLVMKIVVLLSEKGYSITYGDIFKYPTPQTLAAFIEGFQAGISMSSPAVQINSDDENQAGGQQFVKGEDGFDYSSINGILKSNAVSGTDKIEEMDVNPVGDVLLLGSTGYLGIHILKELLSKGQGKVYCVIRQKKGITCAGRLKSYLMYYFDEMFSDLIDKRLFIIEGDMTDDSVMETLLKIKVDTVINCAANVKHFAAGDEMEKINLNGTEKLIDYCLRTGSRLIHTSTHSISGQMEGKEGHVMLESELYFGQKLMTKYQTSKFAAERAILQACATKGLKAKIMRLGNLMPRFSDGEFQINIENNGFMARMRAYYLIGCIASGHLHSALEFAPIDVTADAILTLARTPDRYTVFHPFNNHTIYIDDVVAVMRKCGLPIRITNGDEFNARLNECLKDDHLNPLITTLLAYGSHNNYVMNTPSLDFTVNVLNSMDWRWPVTGTRYLSASFEKMISLDYFNK